MADLWPVRPHDGLGGPQHYPIVIPALVFRDCINEACEHDECPTHDAVVCCRCMEDDPPIGMVAHAQEWPCPAAATETEDGDRG